MRSFEAESLVGVQDGLGIYLHKNGWQPFQSTKQKIFASFLRKDKETSA